MGIEVGKVLFRKVMGEWEAGFCGFGGAEFGDVDGLEVGIEQWSGVESRETVLMR